MKIIIFLIITILYLALMAITISNMKLFDIKNKVVFIIIGFIINFIATLIVINIANISAKTTEATSFIKNVDLFIFTAVNGIITMPTIAKYMNNYKMKIIEKSVFSRKILTIAITFIIVLVIEVSYIKGLKI